MAFDLARSGNYRSIKEIAYKLHSERYSVADLEGPSLRKQLMELIAKARNSDESKDRGVAR